MNRLILTVGLPRSGKSSWARNQKVPIVCPDAIRLALHGKAFLPTAEPLVWAMAGLMVPALFLAGHNVVIVDATNTTKKARERWNDTRWTTYYKVFRTPDHECIRRAEEEEINELIPVIERMTRQWQDLDSSEENYQIHQENLMTFIPNHLMGAPSQG
jgi:predicted kinase